MEPLRAAFVGDVALCGEFVRRARPPGAAFGYPFDPLRDPLIDVGLMVVNLEGPIGAQGPVRPGRSAILHNEPEVLDWLAGFPVCVCSLANNHSMDYGAEGLERTRQLLEERGIHCVGAGSDEREACAALRITAGGLKLGLLAYTSDEPHVGSVLAGPDSPGCGGLADGSAACEAVGSLAGEVDFVVVMLHWGREYFSYPSPGQVGLCRRLAEAGADLVVGHHPHVQQGCEEIGDALVCHSLGNLILPETRAPNGRIQYRKPATKQFAVLHAEIVRKRIASWRVDGGRCDPRYRLEPYSGRMARRFRSWTEEISKPLSSPDYPDFYADYERCRTRQLRREELKAAAAKLFRTDLRTLLRTVSLADLRRNFMRLTGRASEAPAKPAGESAPKKPRAPGSPAGDIR